jgi:ribosomal protein L11 methylase PrmA
VGCGSGIHSLAAHRAGAKSIVSLDVDQDSVATTRALWEREGRPDSWQVMEGSATE